MVDVNALVRVELGHSRWSLSTPLIHELCKVYHVLRLSLWSSSGEARRSDSRDLFSRVCPLTERQNKRVCRERLPILVKLVYGFKVICLRAYTGLIRPSHISI